DRPYRKALPVEEALAELRRGMGKQFDAEVVKSFLKITKNDDWDDFFKYLVFLQKSFVRGVREEWACPQLCSSVFSPW
ncbi:MAG TPA: hypothetical protein EYP17_04145, partial [Candidatus Latescibacteria bacterium]|nr:hypothetical protein [Candidatus Latescibacterota bacterium]